MAMDSWEFNMLTLEERGELVFKRGEFLYSMMYYGHQECLYSYDNFFIKVTLSHDTDAIESIDIAVQEELDRFLNQVKFPF